MSSGSLGFWSRSSTTTANLQHGDCHPALRRRPDSGSKGFQPTPCGGRRCSPNSFFPKKKFPLAAQTPKPPHLPRKIIFPGREISVWGGVFFKLRIFFFPGDPTPPV